MPPVPELGGMKLVSDNNNNSLILLTFFIALVSLFGVAFLVSDTIPNSGSVVGDSNSMIPSPVIEFVDVEIPVFGCPPDFNIVIQTTCVEFGGLVSPVTQESLEEIQNNGGLCEEQETGIVCRPCLRVEQVGWICINNQYLEAVETG